jgi:hypothetical protein
MNLRFAVICLILLPFSVQLSRPAAAADSPLPPTLAKALDGADLDTKDGWAFRQTIKVQALDEPGTTTVTRWDPSRPAGEQCTVVSVTKGDGKEDQGDPCKGGHDRESYADILRMLAGANIQTVSENEERAVYRFEPQGDEHGLHMGELHIDVDEEDAKRMIGTLEVVKTGAGAPYVETLSLNLKEPAGNLLAKLKKLDIVYRFAPEADTGAKLLRDLDVDLALSVFTMFNVSTTVSMHYDEYRKL